MVRLLSVSPGRPGESVTPRRGDHLMPRRQDTEVTSVHDNQKLESRGVEHVIAGKARFRCPRET